MTSKHVHMLPIRSYTQNLPVQLQKKARSLKFYHRRNRNFGFKKNWIIQEVKTKAMIICVSIESIIFTYVTKRFSYDVAHF